MIDEYAGIYDEFSIDDFSSLYAKGELSSAALTDYYLGRIALLDGESGPRLNSVLHLNSEALAIAERLDEERRRCAVRGPLHGIPILLKGNIDTADAMPTTAGSLALEGFHAPEDAPLVARLRRAGAVILGKTNLSEWANFRSAHSSSGWSSEGGQTKNPYALDRNPSGSSSGSAAAVSANLCSCAVGTETDGSIISPSSVNGIVGIKPTVGTISGEGIIPISKSQDTAGPMARTVRDASLLMAAMSDKKTLTDTAAVSASGISDLRGLRLGVAKNYCGFNPAVDNLFEEATRIMKYLGAELIEMEIKAEAGFEEAELEVLLYEFKAGIAAYLKKHRKETSQYRTTRPGSTGSAPPPITLCDIDDLIAFNRKNSDRIMPWFGQELFEKASARGSLADEAYIKARQLCIGASGERGIDAALKDHRLDAILAPSGGPAWMTDHVLGDHYSGGGCTSLPAAAGYPHITVPAGFIHGLPVGLSLFGTAWSEPILIRIAANYEAAAQKRKPPRFRASID